MVLQPICHLARLDLNILLLNEHKMNILFELTAWHKDIQTMKTLITFWERKTNQALSAVKN